jgi:hypothetical protein
MQRKPGIISAVLLIGLLLLPGFAPLLEAQAAPLAPQQGPPPPTAQELDQLLSPIALYPDRCSPRLRRLPPTRRRSVC